ncbi:MAG: hypothetical protein AB1847_12210 [bacterium]
MAGQIPFEGDKNGTYCLSHEYALQANEHAVTFITSRLKVVTGTTLT